MKKSFYDHISPVINHRHLLLDTNFLIEAYHHPDVYADLNSFFSDNEAVLTTINSVIVEFLIGNRSLRELKLKQLFLESMIEIILPTTQDINDNLIEKIVPFYKENKSRSTITDLYLAATCVKYGQNILLVTKNHKDFLPTVFELEGLIPIETDLIYDIYGVYSFSESKVATVLSKYK